MKLLGSQRSPYVRKVLVVASEAGLRDSIELELHSVHLAAHAPEVMALNPLNKIPTLILEDGRPVFDSLVICDVLVVRSGRDDLLPTDRHARLPVLQRHALANGLIDLLIMRLVEAAKPAERRWTDVIESCDVKITAGLDFLARDSDALQSEGCTVGTLSLAVALNYLDFRFSFLDWRAGRPSLAGWHAAFTTRPALRNNPFEDASPALAGRVR